MKRILTTMVLTTLLISVLSGCTVIPSNAPVQNAKTLPAPAPTNTPPQGITVNDIAFEKVDLNTLPEASRNFIDSTKEKKGYVYWQEGDSYYIAIFAGQKPTAGYEINVLSVEDNEGNTNILVETSSSSGAAATVITYPVVLIKASGITNNFNVTDINGETYSLLNIGC